MGTFSRVSSSAITVRIPRLAAANPRAAQAVLFPTPPLPATMTNRLLKKLEYIARRTIVGKQAPDNLKIDRLKDAAKLL
jgi:hypothetical protein